MSIGKGLEVGEIRRCAAVAAVMELDTFLDLLADAFIWAAVRRVECVVAAESAASSTDGAVAVGAAEAGVDGDFLDAGTELLSHIRGVGIETPIITPRIHNLKFLQRYNFFK